ncbi:MAG: hypothetical protein AAF990_26600 [Bacteroidota bacterium]
MNHTQVYPTTENQRTRKRRMLKPNPGAPRPRFPYKAMMKYGILAGAMMTMFLYVVEASGGSYGIKFFKYFFLLGTISWALYQYKVNLRPRRFFQNGILLGVGISFFSGLVVAVTNLAGYVSGTGLSLHKFQLDSSTMANTMVISGVIFFEIFVFGMILTLITLQFLKGSNRPVR